MKMKRGELVGFQGCLGYDYDVVTLKNYLANFYNIPRANIYINIYDGQDNKEGIEN